MDDEDIIAELVRVYMEQNKIISSIVEVNESSQLMGLLYIAPKVLEECVTEGKKFSQNSKEQVADYEKKFE